MQRRLPISVLMLSLCACASPKKDALKTKEVGRKSQPAPQALKKAEPPLNLTILPLPPRGFDMPQLTASFDMKLRVGQIFEINTIQEEKSNTTTTIEILKAAEGFPRAVKIQSTHLMKELNGIQKSLLSGVVALGDDGQAVFSNVQWSGPLYLNQKKAQIEEKLLLQSRGYMVPGHYYPLEDKEYKVGDQWVQGERHPEGTWQRSTRSTLRALLNVNQKKIAMIQSQTVIQYQSGDIKEESLTVYWSVTDGFAVHQTSTPEKSRRQTVTVSKRIHD